MESFNIQGIPELNFDTPPLVSLTAGNYQDAVLSNDLKYLAVSRSYPRGEYFVKDIVLVKIKSLSETVLLDTSAMIRYGRPNGDLYQLSFDSQNHLIAKISDGMDGGSTLVFDVEKKVILKDNYQTETYEDEGEGEEEDSLYDQKITDLKRIFPGRKEEQLSDLAYKLISVDTVGYFIQGILPKDNSIYFLPHGHGKLRLIHNIGDPLQNDNIDGVWGTNSYALYFLKDKKANYLFKYDIRKNIVSLLDKYPLHSHYTFFENHLTTNRGYYLTFDRDSKLSGDVEILKLLNYNNGIITQVNNYPLLLELHYQRDNNTLYLFYLKDGKRCLDIRSLN